MRLAGFESNIEPSRTRLVTALRVLCFVVAKLHRSMELHEESRPVQAIRSSTCLSQEANNYQREPGGANLEMSSICSSSAPRSNEPSGDHPGTRMPRVKQDASDA